jgi:hypothetical protein
VQANIFEVINPCTLDMNALLLCERICHAVEKIFAKLPIN